MCSLLQQRFGKLARIRLDSIVTVVDAEVAHSHIQANSFHDTFINQVKFADVIILNKIDLVEPSMYVYLTLSYIYTCNLFISLYYQIPLMLIIYSCIHKYYCTYACVCLCIIPIYISICPFISLYHVLKIY